jgi:hypothetical protein
MYCEIVELEGAPAECRLSELYEQINATVESVHSELWSADERIAMTLDYETNANLNDLRRIVNYYNDGVKVIQPASRKKDDIIESLIDFELDSSNHAIVLRRKTLWFYVKEISEDKHLSRYLILN